MGMRSTVGWLVRGQVNTTRTLDALSADLRALQRRVDELASALDRELRDGRAQQLAEFDKVRDAVIAATDDLSERIAAVHRSAL